MKIRRVQKPNFFKKAGFLYFLPLRINHELADKKLSLLLRNTFFFSPLEEDLRY
jgi:hypothetical protein